MDATLTVSPARLRDAARAFGDDPDYRDTAAELRDIADRLERGETPTFERPAHRVTYRIPSAGQREYRRKPEEITAELWDGTDPEFHPEYQRFSTRTDAGLILLVRPTGDYILHIRPGEYLCTRRDGAIFKLEPWQLTAEYEPITE